MIISANKNSKAFKEKVIEQVGKSYSLFERLKMNGIGSSKLIVIGASPNLNEKLGSNLDTKFVIAEIRPNGIIVYLKNYINNYVWLIPFHQLSIFKSDFYSLHCKGEFIRIGLNSIAKNSTNKKFLKIVQSKLIYS